MPTGPASVSSCRTPVFEYNASFSPDGKSVLFTSERNGAGQSDVFRARLDGTGIEPFVTHPAVDDAAVLSPDGTRLAFVSTRNGYRANIWVLDLSSGQMRNLTGAEDVQGDPSGPNGFFRPSWSPDSQWLAFSSDRNTDWRGHSAGHGWEHTQELSIYVIRADGQGFRRIASKPGYCLGSPKWSPDGKRVVFYEMTTEDTWGARRPNLVAKVVSQIVSVDVATGERVEHTSGPGLKVFPQFLSATEIAYHRKGGPDEGLYYTSGRPAFKAVLRSPVWSPDGKTVIYEKHDFRPRPENQPLYSWDPEWEYRHSDVFPALSRDGKLVFTEKAKNSSVVIMDPNGSNRRRIFDADTSGLDPAMVQRGMAGAFQPSWSPDGQWVTFGLGEWFQARRTGNARIMRVRRDGTGAGSPHRRQGAFRLPELFGGRQADRLPGLGRQRKGIRPAHPQPRGPHDARPDHRATTTCPAGLPTAAASCSRAAWMRSTSTSSRSGRTARTSCGSPPTGRPTVTRSGPADGRIMWNSGIYGFRDEAALYDNTFQQYGQIFIMNADGSGKRMLTDSRWEDSMPLYIPAKFL